MTSSPWCPPPPHTLIKLEADRFQGSADWETHFLRNTFVFRHVCRMLGWERKLPCYMMCVLRLYGGWDWQVPWPTVFWIDFLMVMVAFLTNTWVGPGPEKDSSRNRGDAASSVGRGCLRGKESASVSEKGLTGDVIKVSLSLGRAWEGEHKLVYQILEHQDELEGGSFSSCGCLTWGAHYLGGSTGHLSIYWPSSIPERLKV